MHQRQLLGSSRVRAAPRSLPALSLCQGTYKDSAAACSSVRPARPMQQIPSAHSHNGLRSASAGMDQLFSRVSDARRSDARLRACCVLGVWLVGSSVTEMAARGRPPQAMVHSSALRRGLHRARRLRMKRSRSMLMQAETRLSVGGGVQFGARQITSNMTGATAALALAPENLDACTLKTQLRIFSVRRARTAQCCARRMLLVAQCGLRDGCKSQKPPATTRPLTTVE